jgi:hypothetical protein
MSTQAAPRLRKGKFGRHCGELDQAFRRGELAVLQLQPLRFHHPEQLLDDPAKLVPTDNLPGGGCIGDLVRGQQPPVQRLHVRRRINLPCLDQPQPHAGRQISTACPGACPRDRPGGRRGPYLSSTTAVRLGRPGSRADSSILGSSPGRAARPPERLPRRRTACRRQPAGGPSSRGPPRPTRYPLPTTQPIGPTALALIHALLPQRPNPHSAFANLALSSPARSFLGGFRTPAPHSAWFIRRRRPEPFTETVIRLAACITPPPAAPGSRSPR